MVNGALSRGIGRSLAAHTSGEGAAIEPTSTQCEQQKQSSMWTGPAGPLSSVGRWSSVAAETGINGAAWSSAHRLGLPRSRATNASSSNATARAIAQNRTENMNR